MPAELIGCYWTLAGNYVFGADDHSPWSFRERAAAAELGAHHIKAAGDFGGADWSIECMHDAFQQLAGEARAVGSVVTLEPIAFSNIPDLDTALAIIGASAARLFG